MPFVQLLSNDVYPNSQQIKRLHAFPVNDMQLRRHQQWQQEQQRLNIFFLCFIC